MPAPRSPGAFTTIPVVELGRWYGSPADRATVADEVRDVCHHVGFFLLVDHGIEEGFVESVFATMRRLFDLPTDRKHLIDKRRSPHFRGWEAVGSEYTNNRPDIREQVDLWTEWPARPTDVEPHHLRLLGPNQWFPEDVLPGYRALMADWFERLGDLARQLMAVMSVGLGLPESHIGGLFGDEQMSLTKLIHYPPTPPGQAGVNAHHDAGFLTILAPGDTPGLEVRNADGDWVPVEPVRGAFVVNLGEMLQGMTGNYFLATPHRVITATERYSAGYFHGPALDTPLAPLPLADELVAAVAASPRHAGAGWMALRQETEAGIADMASTHKPAVYGEQLWNYFARSYPDIMAAHHPALA